jgi:hypothetical protein
MFYLGIDPYLSIFFFSVSQKDHVGSNIEAPIMIFQVLCSTDYMGALAGHMIETLSFLLDDLFESIAGVLGVDEDLIVGLELLAN